jgi:hypothetical protein
VSKTVWEIPDIACGNSGMTEVVVNSHATMMVGNSCVTLHLPRHTGHRAGISLTAWLPEILLLCEQDCSGDPGYFLRKFRDDNKKRSWIFLRNFRDESGFRDDSVFYDVK